MAGILEFRKNLNPESRKIFARLALGQSPDALFISCSDSRVAVNAFASTNPGDLFVVRNVGNLIPPSGQEIAKGDRSAAAAIEFAVLNLKISDIIVCGHSECGAMQAIIGGREKVSPNLAAWLSYGEQSKTKLGSFNRDLTQHNELSQLNVLQQIEHLKTYSIVRERFENGTLNLHGWWFDLKSADVFAYNKKQNQFVLFSDDPHISS